MTETFFKPGSVLGRYHEIYSDAEKGLCVKIAVFLKMRWDGPRPQRDDMDFYVRAAASLYELAKQLHSLAPLSRKAVPKTAEEWLQIITGNRFHYYTDENLGKNLLDVQVSEPTPEGEFGVRVGLPTPFAEDLSLPKPKEIARGDRPDLSESAAGAGDIIDVPAVRGPRPEEEGGGG